MAPGQYPPQQGSIITHSTVPDPGTKGAGSSHCSVANCQCPEVTLASPPPSLPAPSSQYGEHFTSGCQEAAAEVWTILLLTVLGTRTGESFCVCLQMLGEVAMTRSSSRLIGGASGAEMARRALQELISGTWLEQLQSLCTVYCVLYCVLCTWTSDIYIQHRRDTAMSQ